MHDLLCAESESIHRLKRSNNMGRKMIFVALAAMGLSLLAAGSAAARNIFNQPGNILIADQFNNRVIEVDPRTKQIVWQFGNGSSVAGPHSVVAPNDAERVGNLTLISGTGAPAGSETTCPSGCADNRVMLVTQSGRILWEYGQAGVTGAGYNELNTPVQATFLPSTNILITDQANDRVIEVTLNHRIVWQYGMTGVSGTGFDQLNTPNSAELLENGDILIADEGNNRVIEVNRQAEVVWSYNNSGDPTLLSGPAFASRLPNGDTLITDSNNNRVFEVDMDGNLVGSYYSTAFATVSNPLPTRAVRLFNGNTLISNQFAGQVIEVNPEGNIVLSFGTLGANDDAPGDLNAPYDAKQIGDYLGLTPPFVNPFAIERALSVLDRN
jgi:hypothetical protein